MDIAVVTEKLKKNNMNTMPIIKIEVETLKQAMHHAFSQQLLNLDEQFQKAVDEACDPIRIQQILNSAASEYISQVMKEETRWFFLNGPGRKVVRDKVIAQLQLVNEDNSLYEEDLD